MGLATATDLRSLRVLKLGYNRIGNVGLQALTARPLKDLAFLELWDNHITDAGIPFLEENLGLKNFGYLDLRYNRISPTGFQALQRLQTSKKIDY